MLIGMTERAPPPSIEERRGDGATRLALGSGSERSVNWVDAAWVGAAIGLIAGGLATGVAHLVVGIVNPQASPAITVGKVRSGVAALAGSMNAKGAAITSVVPMIRRGVRMRIPPVPQIWAVSVTA